jgi:putative mRNA 3-end processing factor
MHIKLSTLAYGEIVRKNGVEISLHPAGHIVGSAQVRVAYKGEVWVVSGDYKTEADPLSGNFEPVPCHTFITESTFGLPVFKWQPQQQIWDEVNQWWQQNKAEGKTSLLCGYALGKAQRLMQGLSNAIGSIYVHGAVHHVNEALRAQGIVLPDTAWLSSSISRKQLEGAMVIAPPSVLGTSWMRKLQPCATAMASGWMTMRGNKRRQAVDRGFALSDHADWPGLLIAIKETGASNILVTHGYTHIFSRYLNEQGYNASVVETLFAGDAAPDEVAETD